MAIETQRRNRPTLDPSLSIVPLGGVTDLIPYALMTAHPERRLVFLHEGAPAELAPLARLGKSALLSGIGVVPLTSFIADGAPPPLPGQAAPAGATIEDLIEPALWLSLVTEAHKLSPPLSEDELGPDGGLVERTHKGLEGSGETLDRLLVAETAMRRAGSPLPPAMVDRFARLFEAINAHLVPAPS